MTPGHRESSPAGSGWASPAAVAAVAALVGLVASAVALGLAPDLMPGSYSWVRHTTSESAAQGIDGAWMARLGFLLFGLTVVAMAFVGRNRWGAWSALCHAVFGTQLAAAAAFSSRGWEGQPFDRVEDALHSVAATAMGFAFAAGVVLAMVHRRGERRTAGLILDLVALVGSVAIPLAMITVPGIAGALQRMMFLIAYAWYAVAALEQFRRVPRTLRAELGTEQVEIDDGITRGVTTTEAKRIKELEQENRELRRAIERSLNGPRATSGGDGPGRE